MPITIPNFTTTAVITGNTLVSQADEQFNIMMNDIKAYVQSTYDTVTSTLESYIASSLLEMQTLYDNFDDRYLGVKPSNPTLDNDGNALQVGCLYFNSTDGDLKAYNGTIWLTVTAVDVFTKNQVLNTLPAVGLDTSLNNTPNVGQFTWNTADFTANLGMPFGVTQQIGQEFFIPVQNTSGSTILNGRPVMAVGTTGNSGKVLINYHNGLQANAKFIIGLTTSDIANNQSGLITVCGKVRNIDTTGTPYGETWLDGDVIYIKPNSNGLLTKVHPNDSELKMPIAFVIHAHSTGTLMVRTTPIDENHDRLWVTELLQVINNRLYALENP